MSEYTVELGRLIDSGYDIGLTDYPIPSFADEEWRKRLNDKIINHYAVYEICCLPPDRFRLFLNTTMNEIMPAKIPIYEALHEGFKFNDGGTIKETYSVTRESTGESTNTGESSSNANSSDNNYNLTVSSATPAQMLNIENDIANNTYADRAQKEKGDSASNTNASSNSSSSGTTKDNGTESGERTVTGIRGLPASDLFKRYCDAIRNVDSEIIYELRSCFMGIF